jgi:hypothetical protein
MAGTNLETTIHNERTKLTSTWLNGLAIAIAAVGGVAPTVSILSSNATDFSALAVSVTSVGCLLISGGLHYLARILLKRLRE